MMGKDLKRIGALLLFALFLTACAAPAASKWQEQYDLGVRYLTEGNYEEAIVAFTAAIEIDPKQTETYRKLVDVYAAQGEIDKAIDVLRRGMEETSDADLTERFGTLAAQPHLKTVKTDSGRSQIIYGAETVQGQMQGFCILNEYDEDGTLMYLCEGNFVDGQANGELKNYWWVAEKTEHGVGDGNYLNGERNGYSEVRCYHGMTIANPDEHGLYRYDGLNGSELYYEYRGVLIGDIREDDSGDAYILSVNDGHTYEYYGQFKNNELDGYGQIYLDGALQYEGQVYRWGPV